MAAALTAAVRGLGRSEAGEAAIGPTASGSFQPVGLPVATLAATSAAAQTAAPAPHGATHLRRGSDPIPGAPISIVDYGGVGDGGISLGAVNAGSPVVTLANPVTTPPVGQLVIIAGAGPSAGPLESTVAAVAPDQGLASGQFRMADNASTSVTDMGVTWGTNNHDALRDALLALTSFGGGEVQIPPGRYLLHGGIDAWLPGVDPVPGDVVISGALGASQLLVTGGSSTYCTFYRVNSVTVRDLVVRGTPSGSTAAQLVDCDQVFRFVNRRGLLSNVWFYGVAGGSAVVSTHGCDLVVDGGGFLGCVAPQKDVIHCDEWAGLTIRDTEFLDFGNMEGMLHAKASQNVAVTSRSWIGVFNPQTDLSAPVGGVNGSRCVKIQNARFDEGTLNHVLVQPGAPGSTTEGGQRRVTSVDISGTPGLVLSDPSTTGFNVQKVDHLTIHHCQFTAFNSTSGERTAVQLTDVRETKLERLVATTNAGKIVAGANCVSLVLDESAYTQLIVDPATRLRTIRDGQDSVAGAPSSTTSTTSSTTTSTAPMSTTTAASGSAPTNLTITSRTSSTVGLKWNGVPGATEYRAYVSRTSGSGYFLWASGFTGTSATLYSLTGGFYIVVRAVVNGIESANSNEVFAAGQ